MCSIQVSRFDKVACAYFKGWFVIDVVSIFPFDMVGIDNFNGVRMIRYLPANIFWHKACFAGLSICIYAFLKLHDGEFIFLVEHAFECI